MQKHFVGASFEFATEQRIRYMIMWQSLPFDHESKKRYRILICEYAGEHWVDRDADYSNTTPAYNNALSWINNYLNKQA